MREIILISHGTMAKGVFEALKMIIGNVEDVEYACLTEDIDTEKFKKKVELLLDKYQNKKQLLIFADLLGGSPYTSTLEVLQKYELLDKSIIVTGMNLILILGIVLDKKVFTKEELDLLIEEAKCGIKRFEILEDDDMDEL